MDNVKPNLRVAIIGGGPSGLFVYKQIVRSGCSGLEVTIFEKKLQVGAGMPYSTEGANDEHVTNVSDNEIPELVNSIRDWIRTAPTDLLSRFNMAPEKFNEYKVVPRLLFGKYLADQFELLQKMAGKTGIVTHSRMNTVVTDLADNPEEQSVTVHTENGDKEQFDVAIISTGHHWPLKHEGIIPHYFDSPYPPHKLQLKADFPVAIRGASLTAIDAVRTLARQHGHFSRQEDGVLTYTLHGQNPHFRLVMHSLGGLLPAIRVHMEDPHQYRHAVLTEEETKEMMAANEGFIPLDSLFQRNFKEAVAKHDPEFYENIKDLTIEQFVDRMMDLRERLDPFVLLKAEYAEAAKSIKRRQPVYWKEMLAALSFAMNFPAKHLSAEDMLRLKKVLMPLISIVIAFVPQDSCDELLALYDAGILSMVAVDRDSHVIPQTGGGIIYQYTDESGKQLSVGYNMFIDCIGQQHFMYLDFPFQSLRVKGSISPARLKFRSPAEGEAAMNAGNDKVEKDSNGDYYLLVPGITINDNFQALDQYGAYSERIFVMAVPYIGGFNPDYSGLDFCEAASARIVNSIIGQLPISLQTPA